MNFRTFKISTMFNKTISNVA